MAVCHWALTCARGKKHVHVSGPEKSGAQATLCPAIRTASVPAEPTFAAKDADADRGHGQMSDQKVLLAAASGLAPLKVIG